MIFNFIISHPNATVTNFGIFANTGIRATTWLASNDCGIKSNKNI